MSWKSRWIGGVIFVAVLGVLYISVRTDAGPAETAAVIPAPSLDNPKVSGALQTAVLAGGCFWGVQAVYEHVQGVRRVLSGYSGGDKLRAEYEAVSTGRTGHAESVQVIFDPGKVSYGEILRIYFSVVHDPTQLNRQGPDVGTQYRSNIFYADESQKKIAESYIAQLGSAKVFRRTIATRVDPLKEFYPAEDYHQDFLIKHPQHPYIMANDIPKLQNLETVFPVYYRGQAVTVENSN